MITDIEQTPEGKRLTISADLFAYITEGEEPLIEDIDADLETLEGMFPNGYAFLDGTAEYIGASGTYRVTVNEAPEAKDNFEFDCYIDMTPTIRMELKYSEDKTTVSTRWFSTKTQRGSNYQTYKIETAQSGTPFIRTNYGSIFWLTSKHIKYK